MGIKLNFINQTTNAPNADVVIFQKNRATDFETSAVAWRVLENTGNGWATPINLPTDYEVAAGLSDGKETAKLTAQNGGKYVVEKTATGSVIRSGGNASNHNQIEIENIMSSGTITAQVYKDGYLLGEQKGGETGQSATFEFNATIWIGVLSQVSQGALMDSGVYSAIQTKFSLTGIKSADIIMSNASGEGDDTSVRFQLENIVNS